MRKPIDLVVHITERGSAASFDRHLELRVCEGVKMLASATLWPEAAALWPETVSALGALVGSLLPHLGCR